MRDTFPEYYTPSDDEFKKMWAECLFVVDANVLCDLYRYSKDTREKIISALESVSDRIWIPYQAAKEYQNNRRNISYQQLDAYKKIVTELQQLKYDKIKIDFKKCTDSYQKHPFINANELYDEVDGIISNFNNSINEIEKKLSSQKKEHLEWIKKDDNQTIIDNLFKGKVGKPFGQDDLKSIYKEGKERHANQYPTRI